VNKPLVSVIIPVYNCDKYVQESLKSVFNQLFEDYEIIVYEDGTTDNGIGIVGSTLAKFYDNHFLHIIDPRNRGVFEARSEAIGMSCGKYISLHDADDISIYTRLQRQVDFLEEHDDIWCVGSVASKIDIDGKSVGLMDYPPEKHKDIKNMISNQHRNPMIDPSTMFRRDVFDKLGGYSLKKDRYLVDDFDLWCRSIIGGYKLYNFQQSLIKYRINPEGNTRKHKDEMIKQHNIIVKEFRGQC